MRVSLRVCAACRLCLISGTFQAADPAVYHAHAGADICLFCAAWTPENEYLPRQARDSHRKSRKRDTRSQDPTPRSMIKISPYGALSPQIVEQQVTKTPFLWRHLRLKTEEYLPRQARDKHIEWEKGLRKGDFLSQANPAAGDTLSGWDVIGAVTIRSFCAVYTLM